MLGVCGIRRGEGRGEEVPVCGYDGIAFYVDAFGLGLLADGGAGGSVFSFLEGARHVLEGVGSWGICKYYQQNGLVFLKIELIWINLGMKLAGIIPQESGPPTLYLRNCLIQQSSRPFVQIVQSLYFNYGIITISIIRLPIFQRRC